MTGRYPLRDAVAPQCPPRLSPFLRARDAAFVLKHDGCFITHLFRRCCGDASHGDVAMTRNPRLLGRASQAGFLVARSHGRAQQGSA